MAYFFKSNSNGSLGNRLAYTYISARPPVFLTRGTNRHRFETLLNMCVEVFVEMSMLSSRATINTDSCALTKLRFVKKTAASRLAALKAVQHACECIFAVTLVTGVFYAARDKEPLHAEASGHPKVGSAESRLNERLADSSAPTWKVTSSKRGQGLFRRPYGGLRRRLPERLLRRP